MASSLTPYNNIAQTIAIALRILLSYNHRITLQRRSRPPPPLSNRKPLLPPMQLLRPVATHLYHHQHLRHLNTVLSQLRTFTITAGLPFSYTVVPFTPGPAAVPIKDVESAVESFLTVLETDCTVSLPGSWNLSITMRTSLNPGIWGTQYIVKTSHDGNTARLMADNKFTSRSEVESYLMWGLEHSIVNWIRLNREEGRGWKQVAQGNEMICELNRGASIRVEVDKVGLAVTVGAVGGSDERHVWDGTEKGRGLEELLKDIEVK